ncbi:uncharacterized protein LOC128883716 [Hylaeus volcanicus]|uniref:uncharacterized protein LOC128883716 n=1 Tax=Hylaeus volcanicus TaxID=313075 RepID=UPI0023B791EE|nr:uncharacterized protein LOC128883716 [Hylaeus volcanicus]
MKTKKISSSFALCILLNLMIMHAVVGINLRQQYENERPLTQKHHEAFFDLSTAMESLNRLSADKNSLGPPNEPPTQISQAPPATSFKDRLVKETIVSVIQMFLPSELKSYAEKIYDVISKSDAPECNKILSSCSGMNVHLSCRDALPECIISSFVTSYPTEPIMATGEINLQELTNNFATITCLHSVFYTT